MILSRRVLVSSAITLLLAFILAQAWIALQSQHQKIVKLQTLFEENTQQNIRLQDLKVLQRHQQDEIDTLEHKLKASLLNIQLQQSDPASEELVHALLAAKHDALLFLEVQLAEYLIQDRQQDALRLLAQAQSLTQAQKLNVVSYIKNRKNWKTFQQDITIQRVHRPELQSTSYLKFLGIKVQQPGSAVDEAYNKLEIMLEHKDYQAVCLLRPWDIMSEHDHHSLNDLCNPLPRLVNAISDYRGTL